MSHRAVVVDRPGGGAAAATVRAVDDAELDSSEAMVHVAWSSINYKDALAVTGAPGIMRDLPMTAGIDAVGVIVSDPAAPWHRGQAVVLTGAGLGERRNGGLAECVAVPLDSLVEVPAAFTPLQAAAIGTAGFTAALSVLALDRRPLPDGPVLVTGAGGGVGGFAVALLAARGHDVTASTGRVDELGEHLRSLGATDVVARIDAAPGRPLQSQRWAGVVDSVGGGPLATAVAQTRTHGVVTACGLAAGTDLPTSVMPFILRGVDLLGIDSVGVSPTDRRAAWDLLARDLADDVVGRLIDRVVGLNGVVAAADDVLAGRVRGRILVDTRR